MVGIKLLILLDGKYSKAAQHTVGPKLSSLEMDRICTRYQVHVRPRRSTEQGRLTERQTVLGSLSWQHFDSNEHKELAVV